MFIGVTYNSDNDSNNYNSMRLYMGSFNEYYVQDISRKIRKTMEHKRKQGEFVGSFAPYGYIKNPDNTKQLIIDNEVAETVREIFDMFVSGKGYKKIIENLNSKGIPSPSAYKRLKGSNYTCVNLEKSNQKNLWTQPTIYKILRDETYIGTLVQGKSHPINYKNKKRKKVSSEDWIRCPNAHEPIISLELWNKAQERIKNRVRSDRVTLELSPLAGKVKCAVCGRPMKRHVYWNKNHTIKYYNLQCATNKTGAMNCSNGHAISGLQLEKSILTQLNGIIKAYCNSDDIVIEDMAEHKLETLRKRIDKINEQKTVLTTRLENIYADKLDGLITKDEYVKYKEKFELQLSELETQSVETAENIKQCEESETDIEFNMNLIRKYTQVKELTRNIADEFIDTVYICERNEKGERDISIDWKI
mgnify:FL=1